MNEIEVYRAMIGQAADLLTRTVNEIDEANFGKRPGEHLNPASFIYFHVLRHWDRDVNVLSRGQAPVADLWHREGIGDAMHYHPEGLGMRGLGTGIGYTDAQVDAVPADRATLARYQQLLHDETMAYLDELDESEIHNEMTSEYLPGVSYDIAARLQHLVVHTAHHTGDISYVKGALGQPDATYGGRG
ncbi:hypothetical protein BH23CHL2_BH23CHL2_30040 [soil metagenome]